MIGMNEKVERLIYAIAKHEGWTPSGVGSTPGGSRAYRNHNPGNLRWSPFQVAEDGGFAVFRSDIVGLMALQWDLMQKARGNTVTGLNGKSTLRQLIFVYAPPGDNNNSEAYLQQVMKDTGFKATTTLGEIFSN